MKRLSKILVIIIISLFIQNPSSLFAQEYRSFLKEPPIKVYKSMFGYVKKKDYVKVRASLKFLQPVLSSIEKEYKCDLEAEIINAIDKEDQKGVLQAIERLIFFDLKELLTAPIAGEFPVDKLKTWIKTAYIDYTLLSPKVKEKNTSSDLTIKRCFKMAYQSMGSSSPFLAESNRSDDNYRKKVLKIERELIKVFPHFNTVTE